MGANILVVEDNAMNVKLFEVILRLHGYEVRTAENAEDALKVLATFWPQVILMDVQLPGMDGLELTRQLKAAPATQGIRIIAVTANAMKDDAERSLAAGCDTYLAKPIDRLALLAAIEAMLALPSG